MTKIFKTAGVAAIAALALYGSNLEASVMPEDCTVSTEASVTVRAGEQELKVRTSEPVEGELSAEFAEAAKVQVVGVSRDEDGSITIKLNAAEAAAGRHELTIKAGAAVCKGEIAVNAGE